MLSTTIAVKRRWGIPLELNRPHCGAGVAVDLITYRGRTEGAPENRLEWRALSAGAQTGRRTDNDIAHLDGGSLHGATDRRRGYRTLVRQRDLRNTSEPIP